MSTAATPTSLRSPEPGDFSPPYFDHVLAEYELLPGDGKVPSKIQKMIEKYESGSQPTPGELYLLEKYVIYKQPEPVVRARLTGLRASYREIVGANAYAQYLESGQASQSGSSLEAVRADAGRLLDTLHWAYAMVPECEQTRTNILKKLVMEMLVVGSIGVIFLLGAFYAGQTLAATIVLVMLMGALGGFLSVQQRIARISTEQEPILTMFQLQKALFAVRLAPLTGALCALILFLIFQADLLTGGFFPTLKEISFRLGKIQVPSTEFMDSKIAMQFAKLLVWCFIAGFAERFVPDTLNKLAAKQEQPEAGRAEIPRMPQVPEIVKATDEAENVPEAAKAAAGAAADAFKKQAGATGATEQKGTATTTATTDQPPAGGSPEKPDGKPALVTKIS
jgi:hypothetical protein